ncbi:hypothetical protein OZZ15_15925, partial [[Ruminococcus] gnavus]|uniref:hypothetical protein n=1 Tax=Mediterraneibacter gnavus TaxID=33038 RepID=UPI002285A26C
SHSLQYEDIKVNLNTEKFLMKKAKENLSTLESTVIYFSLWRRWLYVYFLNSSLDIVAKICFLLQITKKKGEWY